MSIDFTNGFRIHVYKPEGVNVVDNNFFTLTLKDLELGRIDEKIFLGLQGSLTNNVNIPFVKKFIPEEFVFNQLKWTQTEGFEYDFNLKWLNGLDLNFSNENPPGFGGETIYFPILQDKEDGFFKLKGIEMTIDAGGDPGSETLDASFVFRDASFNFKDFVTLTIDGLGFSTSLTEVGAGGQIGPFDTTFALIPPNGMGLSVDTDFISGGGYLNFDFPSGKFTGAAELKIKDKLTIKIVGALLTKLPDNPDGYSLILIVSAEGFNPVPLGFGFKLTGVGGLVALNRTMDLQAMRDGIKSKAFDNILFPDSPIIPKIDGIVANLDALFPVMEGRHTFGLMGQMIWGKPKLITAEIGLLVEVPSPVKIAILGVIKSKLPTEDNDALKLQVNFIGTIDFGAKYMTFDASIIDSKFATFTLDGDMAFRLKWGDEPNFLLSVGGFHPDFTPPPLNLPTLNRITINLLAKDNPRLTLTSYFAVTSNTVQFGSLVDFYYKVTNRISVVGNFGFDILIQFSPFYLKADLYAMMSVLRNEKALMSIALAASLEGPEPWHARGKAEFKLLEMSLSVNFDKVFGDHVNKTLPDIDVWDKLTTAINDKLNWEAEDPSEHNALVTLREPELEPEDVLSQPNGILSFDQKVVPLNVPITKFGKQVPANHNKFTIDITNMADESFDTSSSKEFFAPANFFNLTDSEKLARKSFEKMDAGVKITSGETYQSSYFGNFQLEYEHIVYDTRTNRSVEGLTAESQVVYQALVNNNAVANSNQGQAQTVTSNFAPSQVKVNQEAFAIANVDDLSIHNHLGEDLAFSSEAEAQLALEELYINHPALINKIDVVAAYELA